MKYYDIGTWVEFKDWSGYGLSFAEGAAGGQHQVRVGQIVSVRLRRCNIVQYDVELFDGRLVEQVENSNINAVIPSAPTYRYEQEVCPDEFVIDALYYFNTESWQYRVTIWKGYIK